MAQYASAGETADPNNRRGSARAADANTLENVTQCVGVPGGKFTPSAGSQSEQKRTPAWLNGTTPANPRAGFELPVALAARATAAVALSGSTKGVQPTRGGRRRPTARLLPCADRLRPSGRRSWDRAWNIVGNACSPTNPNQGGHAQGYATRRLKCGAISELLHEVYGCCCGAARKTAALRLRVARVSSEAKFGTCNMTFCRRLGASAITDLHDRLLRAVQSQSSHQQQYIRHAPARFLAAEAPTSSGTLAASNGAVADSCLHACCTPAHLRAGYGCILHRGAQVFTHNSPQSAELCLRPSQGVYHAALNHRLHPHCSGAIDAQVAVSSARNPSCTAMLAMTPLSVHVRAAAVVVSHSWPLRCASCHRVREPSDGWDGAMPQSDLCAQHAAKHVAHRHVERPGA